MPVIRCIEKMYNMTLHELEFVPDCFKTQKISNKPVYIEPLSLAYVTDYFKTQEMCKEAVSNKAYRLRHVSDHLKTGDV